MLPLARWPHPPSPGPRGGGRRPPQRVKAAPAPRGGRLAELAARRSPPNPPGAASCGGGGRWVAGKTDGNTRMNFVYSLSGNCLLTPPAPFVCFFLSGSPRWRRPPSSPRPLADAPISEPPPPTVFSFPRSDHPRRPCIRDVGTRGSRGGGKVCAPTRGGWCRPEPSGPPPGAPLSWIRPIRFPAAKILVE